MFWTLPSFFPDTRRQLAKRAFRVFDQRRAGIVTLDECADAVLAILQRRSTIRHTLRDKSHIASALQRVVNIVALVIGIFFIPFVFGVPLATIIQTLSIFLVAFTFSFGNSVRLGIEGVLWIFIQRPYDVGDVISVDTYGEYLTVAKISILTTEFITLDGRRVIVPNRVMNDRGLYQCSRSRQCVVGLNFRVPIQEDVHKLWQLRDYMVYWMQHESEDLYAHDEADLWIKELGDFSKLDVTFSVAFINLDWSDARAIRSASTALMMALIRGIREFEIVLKDAPKVVAGGRAPSSSPSASRKNSRDGGDADRKYNDEQGERAAIAQMIFPAINNDSFQIQDNNTGGDTGGDTGNPDTSQPPADDPNT
eukprot:TRINITY_DN10918_c0_g1_i1.p1 TRINITY_DN10918_c0_g1~~TRINITY_DN10918_c0_g1_i1.p1  ORF type:complete len:366 (+),score=60.49 TRINITY_DN10918_c0_g1_i1:979-2076(+)